MASPNEKGRHRMAPPQRCSVEKGGLGAADGAQDVLDAGHDDEDDGDGSSDRHDGRGDLVTPVGRVDDRIEALARTGAGAGRLSHGRDGREHDEGESGNALEHLGFTSV